MWRPPTLDLSDCSMEPSLKELAKQVPTIHNKQCRSRWFSRSVNKSRLSAFTMLQRVKISIMVFNNFHVTTLYIPLPLSILTGNSCCLCQSMPQAAFWNFTYTQVSPHVQKLPEFYMRPTVVSLNRPQRSNRLSSRILLALKAVCWKHFASVATKKHCKLFA